MSKEFTTILLIGEGALLKQLGERLSSDPNQSVWAVISTEGLAPSFARLGLNPLVADLTDPFLTKMAVANADIIYHLSGRRVHGMPAAEPTDLKILKNILAVLPKGFPRRYIYESSLDVYDGVADEVVDEKAFCRPKSPAGKLFIEAEREILSRFSEKGFPGMVFRSGSLYQPLPGIFDQVRKGTYQIPPDLPPLLHRIYIEDYLDVLVKAMEKGRPGQIYNLVDQEPHTKGDYFRSMAASLGVSLPDSFFPNPADAVSRKRYPNEKLLREWGLTLRFPTYREGLLDGIQRTRTPASSSQ